MGQYIDEANAAIDIANSTREAMRRSPVFRLLLKYSEWLDKEGLIVPENGVPSNSTKNGKEDTRTHEDLVQDFFAEDRS